MPGGKTTTPSVPAGIAPVPPAAERVGAIRGQNGLCLDLNGGVPFDGNHVQVFGCNRSSAQTWTIASDGTLRVAGKCALVVGDDSVEIVSCDGRTTAQWRVSGQLVISAVGDECLTDPSGGRWAGTGVRVDDCDGSAKQRWSLP
ncbi:Ricin-type beta-trefoil lectin domain-containing protein [Paractinoplanes atraurantiacus]|uniref:Ricin-type beta-trefoil lectin domain-containing protein n=1 Tax=Paractinoplanes atraurantiacus TaxID=1036182 RepID=A0A285IPT2_9ACTN|nr:Ricin-type beta-trefoil lectin domain-containing protein [Actinoplanes atraurantiacus]